VGLFELNKFNPVTWERLIETGLDRILEPERDRFGRIIPVSELSDEWLTGPEIRLRQESRRNCQNRRHRHNAQEQVLCQREPLQQRELQPQETQAPPPLNSESE
jgi:hypothetical protein